MKRPTMPTQEEIDDAVDKTMSLLVFGAVLLVVVAITEFFGTFDWSNGVTLGGLWVGMGIANAVGLRYRIKRALRQQD